MAVRAFTAPEYPFCKNIPTEHPNISIDQDLLQIISYDADILPLFEKKIYENNFVKQNSLEKNELLRCRWGEYIKRMDGQPRSPFHFPRAKDYHYSNYFVRYNPKETIGNRANNRLTSKAGPGVDLYGQLPIPENMSLRKGLKQRSVTTPTCKHTIKTTKANKKKI